VTRFLFSLSLGLFLLQIGCTLIAVDQPPRITPAEGTKPVFAIPTIRERMIYLAHQEWTLFGQPVADYTHQPPVLTYLTGEVNSHETQAPLFSRVYLYWYTASSLPILGYEGELRPWSGAFIIWLARSAGVPESDLPSTVLHWDYIEHALSADRNARFIARDAKFYSPKPGDLLCAPREEGFMHEVNAFIRLRRGPYHCDIVVERRPNELDLIGGNVLDAVSLTHVELNAQGYVLPIAARPWQIVIEQRDIEPKL
jgi:hypothetical protein